MKVWEEWQKRALVAERENARLKAVLIRIAELDRDEWADGSGQSIAGNALEKQ